MQDMLQQEQAVPSFPTIRNVPIQAAFRWLHLALRDIRRAPFPCLFYGVVFSLMGLLLHWMFVAAPHQTITLATGFMLVGPFLAMGLYETSRRLEAHEQVSLLTTLTAWRNNLSGIGLFAMILALMFAGWMRVSVVVFALFYTDQIPTLDSMLSTTFFTEDNLSFLLVYFSSGFIFALLVFAISVVSIPMLLDRDGDTLIAIFTSSLAMWRNPAAMTVWGLIVVSACLIGFLTYYIGLIITMPIIGLASWHAYRDLVDQL